jgi:biopolymer transport protein ExbB
MSWNLGEMFIRGGWVMYPLLAFSVITWAVVMERAFVYLTLRPRLTRLAQSVVQALKAGDTASARQICHSEKPYVAEVFLGTLDNKKTREYSERITERNRIRLMAYFKKNLWILATVGSSAPFIGLLGTVMGILRAFHSMSEKGTGGFTVVAGGISESLIATAAGLIVAIIALITYNIFVTAANQTVSGLKLTLEELLDQAFEGNQATAN